MIEFNPLQHSGRLRKFLHFLINFFVYFPPFYSWIPVFQHRESLVVSVAKCHLVRFRLWTGKSLAKHASVVMVSRKSIKCFDNNAFILSPFFFSCKPCIQLDLGMTNQKQLVELGPPCLWDGCHETTGIFGTVVNGLSIYHLFLWGLYLHELMWA